MIRETFPLDQRPFIVVWEMTRACALACRHCRASAQISRHPLELNFEESLLLINQVARCQPVLFVLTGGDPLLRLDLEELIVHARNQGLRVALSPSATPQLLSTDMERLRKAGVERISFSLDGASKESHDAFRGVPGTWDWTMEGIRKADEAGIPVQIHTTFTRQNLSEFDSFVSLVCRIHPVLWSVFQLVPTGRGAREDLLSAEEMEDLFSRLARLSRVAPFDIKTTEGQHYRRVLVQEFGVDRLPGGRAPMGINDGKGFVFISHVGNIQPSGFLPITVGQVRKDELLDVYRNAPLMRQLRDPGQLKGKCGRCGFKSICGGSRARAFAMTGDPLGEEPLCVYQPSVRQEINRA